MIRIRNVFRFALLGLVLPIILGIGQAGDAVAATPTDLFISEYIEGSSNNKAIEIYNGTGADVDLAAGVYNIQQFSNGSATAGLTINLTGTIAAGDVYVVAHSSANAAILAQADLTTGAGLFNGDDALVLRKDTTVLDVIGQVGFDPGTEWGAAPISTLNHTLRRKAEICEGDPDGSDAFDPSVEWDGYSIDTFDGLGSHTANCGSSGPEELFISEYIEGSSNNKAIEIFNGTGAAVDLSAGGYNVQQYSNGSATAGLTINLTGTLADGDVFVIAHSSADAAILAQADLTTGAGLFNGDDALALRKGEVFIDVFGQIGFDPGTEWGTGLTSTADNTLRRKAEICAGDPDGSDPFDPAIEWDGYATNTFDGLGSHSVNCGGGGGDAAPAVTGTTPAPNAANVAANTNITITFSEAVAISGTVAVTGDISGPQNLVPVSGDNLTFTLDPADFAAGETVTVTVSAAQVSDLDGQDPPDNLAADYVFSFSILAPSCGNPATLISAVQGSGSASPLVGSVVTIEGIVVGDFQDEMPNPHSELNGFFLQEEDADADGNPATSEGVFVYDGFNPTADVIVGDKVRVTGTVIEFNGLTEIGGSLTIEVCSSANPLPAPATITLPVAALSDLEKYEGMYVHFPQELTVTEIFTLGRYGEVLLSQGGRLPNPTHVAEPGAAAQAVRDANILRSIILDDGLTNQNPDPIIHPAPGLTADNTLRGGDTVTGLTGALYYGFTNEYRLMPTDPIAWEHENPRPATPPDVGGSLRVASYNVLNYFITLGSRGAGDANEFQRQHDKIINALLALDADIVGLIELENHAAANPPGDGVDPVLESIVDALNAALGGPVYDFIDTGFIGTDEIKTAFIYKTATVTPVGAFAILDSSVDPTFIDTRNRPVLAQTFAQNATGERLTVAVNHLKSKGSDCGGAPDDQPDTAGGNCNGTRTAAAIALANWLASDPTGSGDPDYLIIGDLNSYAKEDPIDALAAAGYTDLLATPDGSSYSYVFDGEWGYLDYALSNASLTTQVAGAAAWHTNADEPIALDYNTDFKTEAQKNYLYNDSPFRASDHDPVLIGLNLESNNVPDCSGAYPSVKSIWPPNNKFVNVKILGVSDPDGDPVTITILSIFQDEPVGGPADGKGVGTSTAQVRAERNGNGNGRFYHITYQATDSNGGTCVGTVKVVVPHDKGAGKVPVDGGPLYDSTISQ